MLYISMEYSYYKRTPLTFLLCDRLFTVNACAIFLFYCRGRWGNFAYIQHHLIGMHLIQWKKIVSEKDTKLTLMCVCANKRIKTRILSKTYNIVIILRRKIGIPQAQKHSKGHNYSIGIDIICLKNLIKRLQWMN